MIIQRIEVKNFRSLKDVSIDCHELVAILGRNGSGKSSLLKTIEAFYDVGFLANAFDYFGKDTTSEISIRITYGELRDDELTEFKSYLTGKTLTVTKVINAGGAKYFGVTGQLAEFSEFRKLSALPKRKALNELIESKKYPELGPSVKSEPEADALMGDFEKKNPQFLVPVQREEQFFGPKNVGGGKIDHYTRFVLVPAVRDATSETERKGVILQLIDVLVARSVNARKDVRDLNEEFEKRVKAVYSAENLTELTALAKMVTKLLSQYAPGAELDLAFGDVTPPKILFPTALASLVEDNFKSPISYSGHGLQRALVLALLQQLSLTDLSAPAKEPIAEGEDKAEELKKFRVPDLILAIEEPELYLHPSRSRFLSSVLDQLSTKPVKAEDARTQVLYATHSPYFINLGRFERVRLARKIPAKDVPTLQCKITAFSRDQAAARLAAISQKDPKLFTADTFLAHAIPVMNATVNEGFFADAVFIVEGLTEFGIFWALQNIMNKGWDRRGIVIVPAEGKTKIDRPVVVFRGLEIPTYFLFDGDSKHNGKGNKDEKSTAQTNQLLQRLADAAVVDFPSTQVNKGWAVFGDDVEMEIKAAVGEKYYQEVRALIADDLGYSEPSKALKNPEAAARLIRSIYETGRKVPVLEEIVEAVSAQI
ncbi:MAG: ATP-dependent endonuclease [Burkholderiales bacterium]|nr:ATP-dependent endonuclease [Burkholderiales bacterium]